MANFNKVILAGNLTRDPELRYTPKGSAVAKFTLAINRTWKSESGESKEEVSFVDIEAWGRQAEVIAQYMRKGRPLLVDGRLKQDTWEDKNTHQKQSKLKVVLEGFPSSIPRGRKAPPPGPTPHAVLPQPRPRPSPPKRRKQATPPPPRKTTSHFNH
jgi:single-strand DNA-binding protein